MHAMTSTFPGGNKVDAHFPGFDVPSIMQPPAFETVITETTASSQN